MKINVECPTCLHINPVKSEFAGKKFRCKGCQGVLTVPKEKPRRDEEEIEDVEEVEEEDEFLQRPARRSKKKPSRSRRSSVTLPSLESVGVRCNGQRRRDPVPDGRGAADLSAHHSGRPARCRGSADDHGRRPGNPDLGIPGRCGVRPPLHVRSLYYLYYIISRFEITGKFLGTIGIGIALVFSGGFVLNFAIPAKPHLGLSGTRPAITATFVPADLTFVHWTAA